jgi:hypothetical protein
VKPDRVRSPAGLYRAAEVAELLRCSEWWIKEQARRRRIPFAWIGGSYVFTDDHVAEIIRLNEVRPDTSGPAARSNLAATKPTPLQPAARLKARRPRRARTADQQPPTAA